MMEQRFRARQSGRCGLREMTAPHRADPAIRKFTNNSMRTFLSSSLRVIAIGTLLALSASFATAATMTLFPVGSVWKCLDTGANPGTAWRVPSFDDSAWASGPAEFGYGDGGEAMVVGYGPDANNKYITTYFRGAFTVFDAAGFVSLSLRVLRDDGVVV